MRPERRRRLRVGIQRATDEALEEIPRPCDLAIAVPGDYNGFMEPSFDHMVPKAERAPLSAAQGAEIDRRVADYRAHPETSIPWDVAREQMRRRV